MLSAFTSVLHVPNLSKPEHVINVLEQFKIDSKLSEQTEQSGLFDQSELNKLAKKMSGHKYVKFILFQIVNYTIF